MTVAEIAAAGVAAIFVPYPYAIYDHQTLNARFLADKKAAILISQERFTSQGLTTLLTELATDRPCLMGLITTCQTDTQKQMLHVVWQIPVSR